MGTPKPARFLGKPRPLTAFVLAAGITMALLLLFILVRNRTETLVAGVATALPFGWAFAAGMVSSVNPCGFFLLPAYLSYQLGADDAAFHATSAPGRVLRGLVLGVVVTAGFVLVMGAIGAIIGTGGQAIVRALPYGGLAVGMILAAMGLWLLVTRRSIGIAAARRVAVTPRRNLRNVFFFGMAYAIGSLSCTLPIFLLVVGGAAASGGGFGASLGQFFSYALGMGSILLAVTMGAAVTRGGVARSLRRALPLVDRISALFLLGAGGYLVVYWLWGPGALL